MEIQFYKYQGTGNDFIILDNRKQDYSNLSKDQILKLCDRNFGIGADGLMLLNPHAHYDFEMKYYNSDGNESSMCGNGGRCICAFAKKIGIIENKTHFIAIDGEHYATLEDDIIALQMKNVEEIKHQNNFFQLNTGSPHYVSFVSHLDDLDIKKEGALIRYSPLFKEEGINVNFVEEITNQSIKVRTYERGVEDETLSCGTGVTACALVQMMLTQNTIIEVHTLGGNLNVMAETNAAGFRNIWLRGAAQFVFEGKIEIC